MQFIQKHKKEKKNEPVRLKRAKDCRFHTRCENAAPIRVSSPLLLLVFRNDVFSNGNHVE